MKLTETVESIEELRSIIGFPSELAKKKVLTYLDSHCLDFISKSPFLVLSTSDDYGFCDVSPRGDSPGFVHILDENHFIIPERPGNKRIDSMRNILFNPRVGLLFMIPGLGETLRVNGKAKIVKDEKLLKKMAVNGRNPLLGICVEVEECFIHCAKAFIRSRLWEPSTWIDKETLPSAAEILFAHANLSDSNVDSIAERLKDGYLHQLY